MNDVGAIEGTARREQISSRFQGLPWDKLVDIIPIGIYICDASGALVRYNDQAAQLWGHAPKAGDSGFQFGGAQKIYHLDGKLLERSDSPMAEALRTGQPVREREFILERPDGSRIFIQVSAEPLFDVHGAIIGGVNCTHDITARKEAQNREARDREMLRSIFETTPECIKIVAHDGTLLQMNSAGREMVEAEDPAVLEGASIFEVIAPEFRDAWKSNHERVCNGEKLSWEFDIIGLRGTRRHMETHAAPLRMPDGRSAQLAITHDITRRRQHHEQIRESEHRLKELLHSLPAAIYTTDIEGRITFYNEAAVEFAGRRPALGEQWCVTWRLFYPDGRPMPHHECPMALALKEGRPVRNVEAIAERPDGTRIWFIPYPTPITDSSGQITGAINMLVDITHRKDAEQLQKLLLDELNHRVKNTLATVQSLIAQTARTADTVEDYRQLIEARLLAMSRAHDQISRHNWTDAELSEITTAGLAPYLAKGNIVISGKPVTIPPRAGLMLSMVFHELATNAAKYGALSKPGGKVELGWTVEANGHGPVLRLQWNESGGPAVQPPARRGFGTRLVERGIQTELRGNAAIDFAPSGMRCEIEVPLGYAG